MAENLTEIFEKLAKLSKEWDKSILLHRKAIDKNEPRDKICSLSDDSDDVFERLMEGMAEHSAELQIYLGKAISMRNKF